MGRGHNRQLKKSRKSEEMAAYKDPENTLIIETSKGNVVIELRPDLAPKHVERIKQLARDKFYDGIVFHRVIEGFMAQTGCPQGRGTGSSSYPNVPAEFTKEHFARGTVGMARSADPNINVEPCLPNFPTGGFLDGQYTVFGQVDADGMKCVDQIERGEPVANPDKMTKVTVQ